MKVRGRLVSTGYGAWFLWADRWAVVEGARPVPEPVQAASEEGICDRVHRKTDFPFPGDEVGHHPVCVSAV